MISINDDICHHINYKTDIWSIACLLYELITAEYLFQDIKDIPIFYQVTTQVPIISIDQQQILKEKLRQFKVVHYFQDILTLLENILIRNMDQRPSIDQIINQILNLIKKIEQQEQQQEDFLGFAEVEPAQGEQQVNKHIHQQLIPFTHCTTTTTTTTTTNHFTFLSNKIVIIQNENILNINWCKYSKYSLIYCDYKFDLLHYKSLNLLLKEEEEEHFSFLFYFLFQKKKFSRQKKESETTKAADIFDLYQCINYLLYNLKDNHIPIIIFTHNISLALLLISILYLRLYALTPYQAITLIFHQSLDNLYKNNAYLINYILEYHHLYIPIGIDRIKFISLNKDYISYSCLCQHNILSIVASSLSTSALENNEQDNYALDQLNYLYNIKNIFNNHAIYQHILIEHLILNQSYLDVLPTYQANPSNQHIYCCKICLYPLFYINTYYTNIIYKPNTIFSPKTTLNTINLFQNDQYIYYLSNIQYQNKKIDYRRQFLT